MPPRSVTYLLGFMTAVCVVCSLMVSTAAVLLKDRQDANALLDKQRNVLVAMGALKSGEWASRQKIESLFAQVRPVIVDLRTGEETREIDPATFDPFKAARRVETSRPAPENLARVMRVPNHALVYKVFKGDRLDMLVLPVEGKGLWSTLYGFLALDHDLTTIHGLTFYKHGETPGLGGEVDNPLWKSLWPGRKAFDETGAVRIQVIKGKAGPPESDPYHVDGLSGATQTHNGVTHLLAFWLGPDGFGPYLAKLRHSAPAQPGGASRD